MITSDKPAPLKRMVLTPAMAKPLPVKLGCSPGLTGLVRDCPETLERALAMPMPEAQAMPDVVLAFVRDKGALPAALAWALPLYRRGARLWFAYPKTSGPIRTDISRDQGWEPLDAHDLLGVAQIALDQTWSALRFRYRDEIPRLTRKGG